MSDSVIFTNINESINIVEGESILRFTQSPDTIVFQAPAVSEVSFVDNEPKIVFVTTVETAAGGGGGTALPPELKTVTLNFSLAANQGVDLTATIKSVYSFVALSSTQPDIRIRAYNSVAARAADVSRSHTTMASTSLGLVFEGLTATGYLSMNWAPSPTGYTVDESDNVPLRLDNIATTTSVGSVTLYYYA